MHRVGHAGAALLVYAPVGFATVAAGGEALALVGAAASVTLSTLPDADELVPFVDHRGPTHTLWFALAVGAAVGVAFGAGGTLVGRPGLGGFGFAVGTLAICSHLAADAITPMGVRPLAPFGTRRHTWNLVLSRNPAANYALFAAGLAASVVAFFLGSAVAPG